MLRMKIATWNVAYGDSPSKNAIVIEEMMRIDADIWILTETHDSLCPTAPGVWSSISSDHRPQDAPKVKDGSRWVAIWTRFPIKLVRPTYDSVRTAAGIVNTALGDLLVFGTVLPWYRDTGRTVSDEIARQSEDWKVMLQARSGLSLCVAGDFNVNLGGPHYYGANESKRAVHNTLNEFGLVAVTNFERTGPVQFGKFGLIDHIAISKAFVQRIAPPEVWQRQNYRGEVMSDHCGVAVALL